MTTLRYLLLIGVILWLAEDESTRAFTTNTRDYGRRSNCNSDEKCVPASKCSTLNSRLVWCRGKMVEKIMNKRCRINHGKGYCCRIKSNSPSIPKVPGNRPRPKPKPPTTIMPPIPQEPELVKICGKSNVIKKPDIFPGNGNVTINAQVGDWPWMAALFFRNKTAQRSIFGCGGVLISKRWVLTAAHCFAHSEEIEIHFVRFGAVKKEYYEHFLVEPYDLEVQNYIIHPRTSIMKKNDIALIELEEPVPFSDSIRPICLPSSPPAGTLEYTEGQKVFVTGWGALKHNDPSSCDLKTFSLNVINSQKCDAQYRPIENYLSEIIGEKTICAGEGASTVCQGDSGGPLMLYDEKTDRFYLGGIVSFSDFCKQSVPAVFTRVVHYKEWIEKNTHEKFPAPNDR